MSKAQLQEHLKVMNADIKKIILNKKIILKNKLIVDKDI